MMRKTTLTIALAACTLSGILQSCKFNCVHGSGKTAAEQRKANEFKKIEVSGAFKIHLKQDSSLAISITGDDNLLKYVVTSVDGDKLHIKTKKSLCFDDSLVVNIGVRNLEQLSTSGAIEVISDGKINANNLGIHLSGASKVTMDLNVASLSTDGSGASEFNLKGQAASHHIESSGVTRMNAFDFVVGEYDISTSGASHLKINVLKTLNVHSSGASDIQYKGSPTTVNNDKSGASDLKKVD